MTQDPAHAVIAAAGAYAIAAAFLTMLPGPDTAVVLATAIDGGRRAAVRAAAGISVGLLFWTLAAGAGLAAILRASAELYTGFRLLCAAYLLWLAVKAVGAAIRRRSTTEETTHSTFRRMHVPWGFRRALLTAVLNPKLGVFFVAFLPQFIPESASVPKMTLLLGGIHAAEALVWFLGIGSLAATARTLLGRTAVRRVLDGITAAAFAFFAARLAFDA